MSDRYARVLAAEAAAERELGALPEWIWDRQALPVPIETIADSHYGLLVRHSDNLFAIAGLEPGPQLSGVLFQARREIWIDSGEAERAPVRRRFTIGHELGHWVLHCRRSEASDGVIHCRSEVVREEAGGDSANESQTGERAWTPLGLSYYPPPELDANQFGAALLMPRELVESACDWLDGDVRKLAREFGVSELAMQKRLWFVKNFPPQG